METGPRFKVPSDRLEKPGIERLVLSPFDSRKSDRGNTLHVATICLDTQLFLFIVHFQQYFCHIECDGYDVEN